jgi:hypothetical protein
MTTTSSSLLSMLVEPAFTGGTLLLYEALMGNGITNATLTDALYLGGSNLVANTLTSLFFTPSSTISTIFGTQANTTMIEQNIIVPLLTSIMYTYTYNTYYKQTYNLSTNRSTNMAYVLSFVASFVSGLYSNSIYTLFTTKLY